MVLPRSFFSTLNIIILTVTEILFHPVLIRGLFWLGSRSRDKQSIQFLKTSNKASAGLRSLLPLVPPSVDSFLGKLMLHCSPVFYPTKWD